MSRPYAYLVSRIADEKFSKPPAYGFTRDGYTLRSGAPTSRMVRLEGEKRWRRVMVWQFSNAPTKFLRIGGVPHIMIGDWGT